MPPHSPFPYQRPAWWPENRAWPPVHRRSPFARRIGCLFLIFNLILSGLFWLALAWFGRRLGWVDFPRPHLEPGSIPVFVLAVLFFIGLVGGVFFAGRRRAAQMDYLLAAAEGVAGGNYTAPVREHGPAELRGLIRAFNGMMQRLQADDNRRRNLLADLSHELRTPLTILRGNLEGMLDGVYTPDEPHLRSLLEETGLLERLVEDLRTLALAESGALQLRREPTDLALLLQDTAAAFQSGAAHIRLRCEDETLTVQVDPVRIKEVIANLLSNALKHSPAGGLIELRCRLEEERTVILEVEDQGPGIAADDLPHVFERFYKTSDSTGMGLGLSIAKTLVEAHGGAIEAHSPLGSGALLRIRLPYSQETG